MVDLKMFTELWLDEVDSNNEYNLFRGDDTTLYGVVNFLDFAVYADTWDGNMVDLKSLTELWLDKVNPNNEYNLFRGDDVGSYGIVNFLDFTVLADNWLKSSYD